MKNWLDRWLSERGVLFTALVLYIPFIFLGYGSDADTYNVLWTGDYFAKTFDYVPSRGPGFFVFETLTFFINRLGGSLLTNLSVMLMSLLTLYVFMRLCRHYSIPNYPLLALILVVQPYYWVGSTCTMDYFFSLGFVSLGVLQILRGHFPTAGVAMALGIGSRLTGGLLAAGFLLWFWITMPGRRWQLILTGAITALLTLVFYLPPADFVGYTTRFLVPTVGGSEYWTLYLRAGRFLYKNVYFWGPLAAGLLAWLALQGLVHWKVLKQPVYCGLPWLALIMIVCYEIFYFRIPTEPSYLLPTLPMWAVLAGVIFQQRRRFLYALLALTLLANFFTFNLARPNIPNHATGVAYGIWLEPGHLVTDVQTRLAFMACGYQPCPEGQ
jgi:hypothetical protein